VRLGARAPLAAELAAFAAIVGAHVYMLTRTLHARTFFDEGVYLLSLDGLRHGEALGRDVFASQMPGFYVLLQGVGAVFGVSIAGVRSGMVAVAAIGALLAYLAGRRVGGPLTGLACAGIVVIAPRLSTLGSRIYADLPAMVLALASLWAATWRRTLPAGALIAAACLVKVSALTALPALAGLLLLEGGRRRRLLEAALGAAAVVAVTALVFVRDLGSLWTDAVIYHLRGRSQLNQVSPRHEIAAFFDPHTPFCWLVIAGLAAATVQGRRLWPWLLWPIAACGFMLEYTPLRENESLVLPYALAVPAGLGLGLAAARLPRQALVVATVLAAAVLAAGWVQQLHLVQSNLVQGEDPTLVHAAAVLDTVTKPGDVVISDQPIVAFLADRPVPGNYVDTASLRWNTHTLSDAEVLRDAGDVAAVVAGRAFYNRPQLMSGLASQFRYEDKLPGADIFYGRKPLGSAG